VFLISLRYTAPLDRIDALMGQHIAFLNGQAEEGAFIAWGRKVPRDGGLILAKGKSREEIEALAARDPFVSEGAAEFEVIEWAPSFAAESVAGLTT
jgi:uncharacterized protein YciI